MARASFLDRLVRAHERPLLTDSATGTWFQQNVPDEAGTCCDGYNLSNPDAVKRMYRDKLEAGADLILTNTFNSCPARLPEFELDGKTDELNAAGVRLLREAIAETGRDCFVGGDVGPTGLVIGDTGEYPAVYDSFYEQIRALVNAGVDVLCIETLLQALEGEAAAEAAHDVFAKEGVTVPIYMTCVFTDRAPGQSEHRTFFGETVPEMLEGKYDMLADRHFKGFLGLGATVIGANCSVGLDDVIPITAAYRRYLDSHDLSGKVFVSAKPNSVVMSTQTYEGPEVAAARLPELLDAGADLIGYCCGSWPDHIRATATRLKELRPNG
jgi:5-methyltetrahydrofolate--homocysteine methyltransferase